MRKRECGKKKRSEFGSQELKHSLERTEGRGQGELRAEVGMRKAEI